MDHLSLPNDPLFVESDIVHVVCEEDYDGGPFLTYPLRKDRAYMVPAAGHVSYLDYELLYPTPVSELESFLQAWLFFGLLREILGELFHYEDFVIVGETNPSATRVVSTSKLLSLIDTWIRSTATSDSNGRVSYEHIAECLWLTRTTLQAAPAGFNPSQLFSIASVAEMMGHAANKAFNVEPRYNRCPNVWTLNLQTTQRESQMLKNGWCPSEISKCMHLFKSLQTLHFLSRMGALETSQRHRWCSKERCEAYQNNLRQYQTVHRTVDCSCDDYVTDSQAVVEILEKGAVPVLKIHNLESLDGFSAEVVECQPDHTYIALSHTWADGLGNPHANTLPRCQLLHISKLASTIVRSVKSSMLNNQLLIWLDTLCCPVKPVEARQIALARMKQTYQQANHVLVLDASLQIYNCQSLNAVEACARIFTSGWMRRLWTLQEGSLAKTIWFQFRDGAVDLHSLWSALCRILTTEIGRKGLAFDLMIVIRGLRTFFHRTPGDPTAGPGVSILIDALQHRSVSVASDEPLLIGNLLNLDVGKILQSPIELRMQTVWSQMWSVPGGIPRNILFHSGPKLVTNGHRWAPATLLIPRDYRAAAILPLRNEKYTGIPCPEGLLVQLPGFFLSSPMLPPGLPDDPWNLFGGLDEKALYMRDRNKIWYQATGTVSSTAVECEKEKTLLRKVIQTSDHHAVLLASEFDVQSDLGSQTRNALLVEFQYTQDGVSHVQSRLQLIIVKIPGSLLDMLECTYQCAQILREGELSHAVAVMNNDRASLGNPVVLECSEFTSSTNSRSCRGD
ncbi:hypothetical protein MMC29_003955 [Sticta canariensis]|nr:hypothetical protein [Sticta canariensis]